MSSTLSSSPASARALEQLAQRLSSDSAYMACVFQTYQTQERLDRAGLATRLGLPQEGLTRLALCKRPSSDQSEFSDQVRQIAAYVGLEPVILAQLIRQVEAVETAKTLGKISGTAAVEEAATSTTTSMRPGWLAAARDRDEADDHPEREETKDQPDQESER